MFTLAKPADRCRLSRQAYTLIELLAISFVIGVPVFTAAAVSTRYGRITGVTSGLLAVPVCILLVVFFYRQTWRREERLRRELREKYRAIYRVTALPTEPRSIVKPVGAEIIVGDYGWEARPMRRDGLIHLQGLTTTWKVVWHAGFHRDQLENVAIKPGSQYDYWVPYWAITSPPPPCPFPVQERNTPTMGLPHFSGYYFINYPSQFHCGRNDKVRN